MHAPRCDTRLSRRSVCGQVLLEQIDAIGRVRWTCQRCTWRAAGRCWQCAKPRESTDYRAVFCTRCKRKRDSALLMQRLQDPEARKHRQRMERAARKKRPELQAKNTQYKRAWVQQPGVKERLAKAAKTRYHARANDPTWRAYRNAQCRARYHARKQAAQESAGES